MIDDKANEKWDRSQNFPINPQIKKQKELRPCPFCGDKPAGTKFLGNPYCVCLDKAWSIEDWNSAYCWKRIDELESNSVDYLEKFKTLKAEGESIIFEYEKKLSQLTQLLGTERDQFGKRETELMMKLRVAKAQLEWFSDYSCDSTTDHCCDYVMRMKSDEALEKLGSDFTELE